MSGILLDRSEFLALMDAVDANGVVGVDLNEVAPADYNQHKALVEQGLNHLQEAGVLRVVDDVNVLDVDLLSMAVLIAHPEVAVITTREDPDKGQQLFLHYLAGDVVMEQTRPSEEEFRWALVPNRPALVERILGILPIQEAEGTNLKATIGEQEFLDFRELVDAGDVEAAKAQLGLHGLTGESADLVIAAVQGPVFAGTVAVLRCENDEIVDARNLLVIQDETIALLIQQVVPGEPTLEIKSCDAADLRSQVTNWIFELSGQQN